MFGFSVLTVTRALDHHLLLVIAVTIISVSLTTSHAVANDGVWVTSVCLCGLQFIQSLYESLH